MIAVITLQNSGIPIYLQIYNSIRDDIETGRLPVRSKLEPERVLAHKLGVTRSTVSHAYQKLHDEGYLTSRQGSAHIVMQQHPSVDIDELFSENYAGLISPLTYMEHNSGLSSDDGLYRSSVDRRGRPVRYYFAATLVPEELCPTELIGGVIQQLLRERPFSLFDCCESQGLYSMRMEICKYLQQRRVNVTPGQVVVGTEIMQLMDFLLHVYIKPGDTIVTEEPIFIHTYQLFRLHHANVVTVPMDHEGIRIDLLERELEKHKPKFIVVTPSFHNPTNITMSLPRRIQFMNLTHKYEVPVIECTFCEELDFDGTTPPALKSMDTDDFVIYIGNFNASFAQGVPLSYVAASPRTVSAVTKIIQMTLLQSDPINQHVWTMCLRSGAYSQHLSYIRGVYQQKQAAMYAALDRCEPIGLTYFRGRGGGVVWCKLPDYVDSHRLMKRAAEENLFYYPGELYYPNSRQGRHFIRLSFIQPSIPEIEGGIQKLKELILEQRGEIETT